MGWQPIETAPKDRKILGYHAGITCEMRWVPTYPELIEINGSEGSWVMIYDLVDTDKPEWPVYWMPLPEPPPATNTPKQEREL